MKKHAKLYSIILSLILFSMILIQSVPSSLIEIKMLLDSPNTNTLPSHFRMSTDKLTLKENQKINLMGLENLKISGSGQFSEKGFSLIKDSINTNCPITVVDLRQESHGFINGAAISFENEKNNSNIGLTKKEVTKDENKRLASICISIPIKFSNNTEEIVPTKVVNEHTLTKESKASYMRFPVTDGGLPSSEMIDEFIKFVNKQDKNSWLHFHCKAGLGRTTTFMIMYDIIKNCEEVSLDDIITRQVLLSKMSEKNAEGFYKGNRYVLLYNFYNKCKGDSKDTSVQCLTQMKVEDTDSYSKNDIIPKSLYVISIEDMTKEEQTMIATLQGIVATKSDKQIYLLSKDEPDYKIWLKDLEDNYKVKTKIIKDPWKLLKKFKGHVNGYIIYNYANKASINNASSLAGLKDSIVIDESLEGKVKKSGVKTCIEDCRDNDKNWAYNNLWAAGLNHSTVIELSPDKTMALRDYAIVSKSLVFYEEEVEDSSFREEIFNSMDNTARCLGWGPDEHTNVSIASKSGVDVIAADWSYNLSVLSAYPSNPKTQNISKEIPKENDVHYVTFVISDGDNQQWFLGSNFSLKNWYGSPYRGNFNLGWSISPSLYYLAPTVFDRYYKSASNSESRDIFVTPPSGNGYMYPSKFPSDKLDSYTKRLNNYMEKVDQSYVLILDDEALYKKELWDKYTCNSNIDGLLYLNYYKNSSYGGKIVWSNGKPVVSCRDLLWEGLETDEELIKNINERVALGETDISNASSYSFVYVHVWSKTMEDVKKSIEEITKNPKVRVVNPDTFMRLIKTNVREE